MLPGSDLVGDEEMVLVTPPDSSEAVALRGIDGRELGRRAMPPLAHRIAVFGRRLLNWDDAAKSQLSLFDPWTQKAVWHRGFASGARFWLIDSTEIGVLEPAGRFAVLAVSDGRDVLKAQAEPLKKLEGIVVRRAAGRYVVITVSPTPEATPSFDQTLPGDVAVGGGVYGFEARSGKRLWAARIPNQSFQIHQPRDLPVLAFFSVRPVVKADNKPNGTGEPDGVAGHLLCLDAPTATCCTRTCRRKSTRNCASFALTPVPGVWRSGRPSSGYSLPSWERSGRKGTDTFFGLGTSTQRNDQTDRKMSQPPAAWVIFLGIPGERT